VKEEESVEDGVLGWNQWRRQQFFLGMVNPSSHVHRAIEVEACVSANAYIG
jgi:hypothetical protein